jgi:GAF domain-containing protein
VTSYDSTPPGASRALEELGSLALREHSMETLLQRVVDLAKEVMPGRPEASLLLLADDQPMTAVFTGQLAMDCDETQYDRGHGPCLNAARTGEVTEVLDNRTDPRWPDYARAAAERGALSSLSIPLPISEGIAGALNIYAREPGAFDKGSRAAAQQFVPYAAVALSNMRDYEDARTLADNLRAALDSRAVIDQAKGILMERHKVTADRAFQILTRASMQSNVKLRVIAAELVMTGQLAGDATAG